MRNFAKARVATRGTFLVLFLGILLGSWAFATPVGSAADDNYHLSSIWCDSGTNCTKVSGGYLLPSTPAGKPFGCYITWVDHNPKAYQTTAKCITTDIQSFGKSETNWLNQSQHLYPSLFYKISSYLVDSDIEASVLRIRFLWILFFIANFIFWIVNLKKASSIPFFLILAGTPLLFFLIPSTNPSSTVITSSLFVTLFLKQLLHTRDRNIKGFIFLFIALDLVIATGSRVDAFLPLGTGLFFVVILHWKEAKENSKYLAFYGILLTFLTVTISNLPQTIKFLQNGLGKPAPHNFAGLNLLISNFLSSPKFIAGFWGYDWGLGWKFEPPIPGLFLLFLTIVFIWNFLSIIRSNSRYTIPAWTGLTLLVALIVYFHQASNVYVGDIVQPRYLFPTFLAITFAFIDANENKFVSKIELMRARPTIFLVGFFGIFFLYFQMLRVVNGINGNKFLRLGENSWWWTNSFFSPLDILILGTLSTMGYIICVWRLSTGLHLKVQNV